MRSWFETFFCKKIIYIPKQLQELAFGQRESFRNSTIVSRPILTIWGDLRSSNFGALAPPKCQFLKLFGYTVLFFFSFSSLFALEQEEKEIDIVVVPHQEVIQGDYFAYVKSIEISGTVNGDVYLFGGQIFIDGTVNGDVLVAGGSIEITGKVAQDVRLLGGQAHIGGEIGKNVTAVTATIEFSPSASVGQNIVILSGNVDLESRVQKNVRVYGSNFRISNGVGGDVKAYVGQLRLTSRADIGGGLEYWSNNAALIDQHAKVMHGIIHHPSFFYQFFHGKVLRSLRIGSKFAALLMNFLYTFVLGMIVIRYFPRRVMRTIDVLNQKPFQAAIAGIILLILLPIAFIALLITILGAPFALTLLAINVISFYTAKIFSLLWVANHLFHRFAFQKYVRLNFTFVLLLYYPLTLIPYAGAALSLAALLLGLGGLVLGKAEGI